MQRLLPYLQAQEQRMTGMLRRLVECESPSDDAAAVNRCGDLIAEEMSDIATVTRLSGTPHGDHLVCEFHLPGETAHGQLLALGHLDTVWPIGTLAHMPFRVTPERIHGPGTLDMKAGVVFFVFAMRALKELAIPVRHRVLLQLNSDEEIGSETSRPLTEENARQSAAVLVLEPGTGLDGHLKTARKGVGDYELHVTGRAAHAGVDFTAGASAVLELARQIDRIAAFTDVSTGTTVNPGVIRGGTKSNVIAAAAVAEIDFRVERLADADRLAARFAALTPFDPRCRLTLSGGLNRPPMERTPAIAALFAHARSLAATLGIDLHESATGGGSDGNFTAAVGAPTLDGLGAVGEGAHAIHESILRHRIADRAALLAMLCAQPA